MPSPLHQPGGLPQPCPLTFHIDGDEFTLPELPVRYWLDTLALQPPGCWWFLTPVSLPDDQAERMLQRLTTHTDPFDLDDLEEIAISVAGAVCGIDFWAATRLAGMVRANWMLFDGWCVEHGFAPAREPIDRVLAAAYTWRRGMCERKNELMRLNSEIWAPSPALMASGRERDPEPTWWDDEMEANVFQQALNQSGNG